MKSHSFTLCSYALFFIISNSSSQHSLASYHKLKEVSLSLCPLQENSTVPQCVTLIEKLAEIRATLIEGSIGGVDDQVGEVIQEQGSLRKPLIEQTLAVINAFEDQQLDSTTCEPGEVASLLFSSLKEVSDQWSNQSYDKHYLILFVFCAVILGLLLASQIYHCIVGHMKDRKVRQANREAGRAQALYSNLQQIHRHTNQIPLMERRQY